MVRRKINVKARRLAIALLAALVLMKGNLSGIPMNKVLAEGAVVLEDPTSIAQTQIYKEMDRW